MAMAHRRPAGRHTKSAIEISRVISPMLYIVVAVEAGGGVHGGINQ